MPASTYSRRRVLGTGAGLALTGLAAPAVIRRASAADELVMGTITPHTGTYGYAGKQVIEGAKLAIEMHGGEILGKPIRHVTRDSEGKPAVGVRRLSEALSEGVTVFNGNYSSAVGLAQSEIAAKRKVLQYSAGGSEDFTGSRCSRYTFHWSANTYTAVKALMDYVQQQMPDAKRWYTITADYVFGQGLLKYAKVIGEEKGIEFVGNDFHPLGERQYTQYITKAIASKPDVLCLLNGGTDAVTCLRQFHNYGAEGIQIVTPWGLEADQMPELAPEMREGIIIGQNYYYDIDSPANRKFVEAYREAYGAAPAYAGAYGYDSFRTVLMAMEKAGTTEVRDVITTLEGMQYDSILGPTSIDAATHQTVRPYFILKGVDPAKMEHESDFARVVYTGSDKQPAELNECEDIGSL